MPSEPGAYVIIDVDVQDRVAYAEYLRLATPTSARFGGSFIVRGGNAEALEDSWCPTRLVIIAFPDREAAHRWFGSPEYQTARRARRGAATFRCIVVDALSASS